MIERISRDLRFTNVSPNLILFLNLFKTRKAPPPKQLAVGGAAGWAAGYLTMKVNTLNWLFFKLDEKNWKCIECGFAHGVGRQDGSNCHWRDLAASPDCPSQGLH